MKDKAQKKEVPEKYITEPWSKKRTFDFNTDVIAVDKKSNGCLKVLQLTDIHFDDHNNKKIKTLELIRDAIEGSNPDIIAVTGDWVSNSTGVYDEDIEYSECLVTPHSCPFLKTEKKGLREKRTRKVFDLIDSFNIPWAPVFGNHDDEGELSKYDYADIFESYKNCLFRTGYSNLKGAGNYVVAVKEEEEIKYILFFLDSHRSLKYGTVVYDCFSKNQVQWVKWCSDGINRGLKNPVPALAFFHISVKEYKKAYRKALSSKKLLMGGNRERVFHQYKNTGMFKALLKSGVKGIFCGHDHNNFSAAMYKGCVLTYGVQSGWCEKYATGGPKGSLIAEISPEGKMILRHQYFDMLSFDDDFS